MSQQPSLILSSQSDLEAGQGKRRGFPLTTDAAAVLNGRVSEESPALPQGAESTRLGEHWALWQRQQAAQICSDMVFFF